MITGVSKLKTLHGFWTQYSNYKDDNAYEVTFPYFGLFFPLGYDLLSMRELSELKLTKMRQKDI